MERVAVTTMDKGTATTACTSRTATYYSGITRAATVIVAISSLASSGINRLADCGCYLGLYKGSVSGGSLFTLT